VGGAGVLEVEEVGEQRSGGQRVQLGWYLLIYDGHQ
jgi:hypothetical protein